MKKYLSVLLLSALLLMMMIPSALAGSNSIKINTNVQMNSDGSVTISWDDTNDSGFHKYYVLYEYISSSGNAIQSKVLAAETSSTSVDIKTLIPGAKYRIYVSDFGIWETSAVIDVPSKGTVSSKRKVSIKVVPKYRTSKFDYFGNNLKTMSASAMKRNMSNGYQYGIDYQTTYKSTGRQVEHDAVFALYAPNGYAYSYSGDFVLPEITLSLINIKTYYGFIGASFFEGLLEKNGEIPVGTYKLEIYLEGRFYKSASFKVSK